MHAISKRYRKPKGRPSKKRCSAANNISKRWSKESEINSPDSSTKYCDDLISNKENLNNSSTNISSPSNSNGNNSLNFISPKFEMLPSASDFQEKVSEKNNYVLMNTNMWAPLLSNIKCEDCSMTSLDVLTKGTFGFASKIELICKNCEKSYNSVFSSPREGTTKCFEANKKLVEAFLKIGKGHAALEVFSMAIGIHAIDKKTFSKCLVKLCEEKKVFKNEILQISRNVVRQKHIELNNENTDVIDVAVSYDGTWQKRGHTSLYGIGIVVDILTGLVLDFEVLSKYCAQCTTAKRDLHSNTAEFHVWYDSHKPDCDENFAGSSNSMEMKAAEILWKRSVAVCGMRYTSVLSDGDAKTHQHLSALNIYANVKITKEECINHVSKRLGTGLRNKVVEWRSKGITLGGRKEGSLKEETIIKLTNFYRKAIKDNIPDIEKMKSAIYASLYHSSSTDKLPRHSKCPPGPSSWCFYQRAIANEEKPNSHKSMKTKISEDVLVKILPVYQRLASNELLQRCVSGKTQNINESIHSCIWKNCPKETFVSLKRLELAVITSVSEFNFGCLNTLSTEKEEMTSSSVLIAQKRDMRRLNQIKKRSSLEWKQKKIIKKISKSQKIKKTVLKEGETYSCGKF